MTAKLRLSGKQYRTLRDHLLPPDGKEAVAVALCGRLADASDLALSINEIQLIPYEACTVRTEVRVTWPTSLIVPLLEKAMRLQLSVLKIHSHRWDVRSFSDFDDESDRELFTSASAWLDSDVPHASAILVPNGDMIARVVDSNGGLTALSQVAVAGDDLMFWRRDSGKGVIPQFALRHAQAFGRGTTERLRQLTIAVVGCSGTGSPVVELLARLGVGKLILVDPERVEEKNLNRILNATMDDAKAGRLKVEVLARAVRNMGLGTEVVPIGENVLSPRVVRAVATADVLFGCMDGAEGRNLLNRLAAFYCLPYFDVGVRLDADGEGGVSQICGGVHYLQPGGSSLLSRGVITREDIDAEGMKRTDPAAYAEQVKRGYIRGVREDRPAVASVNMHFASLAVNEFLARLHPYRDDGNEEFAWLSSSLTQVHYYHKPDGEPCKRLMKNVGRGDVTPLLDMPALTD